MTVDIRVGDAREVLAGMEAGSVHMCLCSPPYWSLRAYLGGEGMIGLEPTWDEHLDNLLAVFRQVWRVLRDDGTLWLNYGDGFARGPGRGGSGRGGSGSGAKQASNAGSAGVRPMAGPPGTKAKDLMMMPARVALALQADGWILRSEIILAKLNPMPESVTDRPTSAHEKMFLFSKKPTYFYDAVAVRKERSSVEDANGFRGGSYTGGKAGPRATTGNKRTDKQRGHERRHDGFNDRWDGMSKAEQQAMGANLRNWWPVAVEPYKGAHFATFGTLWIEPCILAGTSAKGCCPECGAPWVRVTKKRLVPARSHQELARHAAKHGDDEKPAMDPQRHPVNLAPLAAQYRTLRWEPSCECKAGEPKPAVILDPFGGAGTTGLVADRHQRDAVLIEISDEYAELARERIHGDAPLLADV